MAQSITRERAEAKRREKLEDFDEQVRSGSLVVRQMTDEERARFARSSEARARGRR